MRRFNFSKKMKICVKTLKGTYFTIEVKADYKVADVKKIIASEQGYPAKHHMLIHQGKVLKDDTTLGENKVDGKSDLVVMLTKGFPDMRSNAGEGPLDFLRNSPQFQTMRARAQANPQTLQPMLQELRKQNPHLIRLIQEHQADFLRLINEPVEGERPQYVPESAAPSLAPAPAPAPVSSSVADVYGQATSNLVAGSNLEATVQQILDMGGGSWDRETVIRALRAAYNNPERAVEYLHSGLPNMGSNARAGTLDFLRNSQQFQALRAMVQANPQVLQPMLQELGKQNPHLIRLIQEHQADFLRLINEPVEGGEGNVFFQSISAMPPAVTITPQQREAIERLEAMGFYRALVLEVYFTTCNKDEERAANYLLDHMHEF